MSGQVLIARVEHSRFDDKLHTANEMRHLIDDIKRDIMSAIQPDGAHTKHSTDKSVSPSSFSSQGSPSSNRIHAHTHSTFSAVASVAANSSRSARSTGAHEPRLSVVASNPSPEIPARRVCQNHNARPVPICCRVC